MPLDVSRELEAYGIKPPSKLRGRLSQWAYANAEQDLRKKGANFVPTPISGLNIGKNTKSCKPLNFTKMPPGNVEAINFKNPLLKLHEEQFKNDYLHLLPEVQQWALSRVPVVEDIFADKKAKIDEDDSATSTPPSSATKQTEDVDMESQHVSESEVLKNMQQQRASVNSSPNESLTQQESKVLSKYPLIAVCSSKESVIYELPRNLLKYPNSKDPSEALQLDDSDVWTFIQGTKKPNSLAVTQFLTYMWSKTVEYTTKHREANTLNDHLKAFQTIREARKIKFNFLYNLKHLFFRKWRTCFNL